MTSFQHFMYLIKIIHAVCSYGYYESAEQRAKNMGSLPFCFMFSKDTTKSESDPGNAAGKFARCGTLEVDGGRCPPIACTGC